MCLYQLPPTPAIRWSPRCARAWTPLIPVPGALGSLPDLHVKTTSPTLCLMKRKLFNHPPNSSGDAKVLCKELRDIWKSFLSALRPWTLFFFFFSGPLPAAHPHPKSPRGPRWHLLWLIYQHVRPPAAWPVCVGVCSHARPWKKKTQNNGLKNVWMQKFGNKWWWGFTTELQLCRGGKNTSRKSGHSHGWM